MQKWRESVLWWEWRRVYSRTVVEWRGEGGEGKVERGTRSEEGTCGLDMGNYGGGNRRERERERELTHSGEGTPNTAMRRQYLKMML